MPPDPPDLTAILALAQSQYGVERMRASSEVPALVAYCRELETALRATVRWIEAADASSATCVIEARALLAGAWCDAP